jgi:hypothetical protein
MPLFQISYTVSVSTTIDTHTTNTKGQHTTIGADIELKGGIANTLAVLYIIKYPEPHTNPAQYCYGFNHIELVLQKGNPTSKQKENKYKRISTNSINIKKICCNTSHSQCSTNT